VTDISITIFLPLSVRRSAPCRSKYRAIPFTQREMTGGNITLNSEYRNRKKAYSKMTLYKIMVQ
jgi:hypothetical protein